MSWTSRLSKIGKGIFETGTKGLASPMAPVNIARDIAGAAISDRSLGAMFKAGKKSTLASVNATVGKGSSIEAVVGGLPEASIRTPIRTAGAVVEGVYRNVVSRPLATLGVATMLSEDPTFQKMYPSVNGDIRDLFNNDLWQQSRKVVVGDSDIIDIDDPQKSGMPEDKNNMTLSWGQAFALYTDPDDISLFADDEEMQNYMGSDGFRTVSAVADGFGQMFLDPTIVLGKVNKLRKAGQYANDFNSAEKIDKAFEGADRINDATKATTKITSPQKLKEAFVSKRVNSFMNHIEETVATRGDGASAVIRDELFPNSTAGAQISDVLVTAQRTGGRERQALVLRSMIGDPKAIAKLQEETPALMARIERTTKAHNDLMKTTNPDVWAIHREATEAAAKREMDELYNEAERVAKIENNFYQLDRGLPATTLRNNVRNAVKSSTFYQSGPLSRPLQAIYQKVPQRMMMLEDPASDVQLHRFLEQAKELTPEQRLSYRSRYLAATDPRDRMNIAQEAEKEAITAMARSLNMHPDDIDEVLRQSTAGREESMRIWNTRKYDAQTGRSTLNTVGDQGEMVEMHFDTPVWMTQEMNYYLLPDLNLTRKLTYRSLHHTKKTQAKIVADEFAEAPVVESSYRMSKEGIKGFDRMWRPAVLLNFGTAGRIGIDDQLRIMAKIGAVTEFGRLAKIGNQTAKDVTKNMMDRDKKLLATLSNRPTRKIQADEAIRERKERGVIDPLAGEFEYKGHNVDGAFGAPGDTANIYRAKVDGASIIDQGVGTLEKKYMDDLRTATGSWKSLDPTNADDFVQYPRDWERDVNLQIGQDAMGKRVLKNRRKGLSDEENIEDIDNWLAKDKSGKVYAHKRRFDRGESTAKVAEAVSQVRRYIPDDGLIDDVLEGNAKFDDLFAAVGNEPNLLPTIHGEMLQSTMGKGAITEKIAELEAKAFNAVISKPSRILGRQNFYAHEYSQDIKRKIDRWTELNPGKDLPIEQLKKFQDQSRMFALDSMKSLLQDFSDQSRFAEMMRFIMPFYPAAQNAMTTWAGLAIENPDFIARALKIWESPERAGIVYDEEGNRVNQDGTAITPDGRVVKAGEDRLVYFQPPDGMTKTTLIADALDKMGPNIQFNKDSVNTVLTGLPGVHPLVQLPIYQLTKDHPSVQENLDFIFPAGVPKGASDIIIPKRIRDAKDTLTGKDTNQRAMLKMKIWNDEVIKAEQANGEDIDLTMQEQEAIRVEAFEKADKIFKLQQATQWVLPAAMYYTSPYQFHHNAWKNLQNLEREDPAGWIEEHGDKTPQDVFLEEYGEEYIALTMSFSKSRDGVMPTIAAAEFAEKNKDLIEEAPEWGRFIIGAEGAGEYSNAVYSRQFSDINPITGQSSRYIPSPQDRLIDIDASKGYREYRQVMDYIEAERIARGLPSINVKAGADLARIKKAAVEDISERHPGWAKKRAEFDELSNQRMIQDARLVVSKLKGTPDRKEIDLLSEYLEARDWIVDELARRHNAGGAATLDTYANQDLARMWDSIVGDLTEQDLAFGDLHTYKLDQDRPQASDIEWRTRKVL